MMAFCIVLLPECPQSANAGYAFVPESDLSSKFKAKEERMAFIFTMN